MEKESLNIEKGIMNNFNGLVILKSNGEIIELTDDNADKFISDYDAKLAVIDDQNIPYGAVDEYLIANNPKNLIIKNDNGRSSIDIMSEAIKEASELGLGSIAISADTIEEIQSVEKDIIELLLADQHINKIGFYYPKAD